jgi:hypothetical protein
MYALFLWRKAWLKRIRNALSDAQRERHTQAGGNNCVLASLMADKIESSVLELMFEEVFATQFSCR